MSAQTKKGPKVKEYLDDPECKYVVIQGPWPGNKQGRDRDKIFYNLLGAWVRYMLGKRTFVEAIYSMNKRDDVIVQLSDDIDILPILGVHRWSEFLNYPVRNERSSCVFEFNYRMKGHPAEHQWAEHFPETSDPPPSIRFPVKDPYPRPHWIPYVGETCRDLALPLPPQLMMRTPTPPPVPPPLPPQEDFARQGISSLAKQDPYEADESARLALGGQGTNPPPIVNVPVKAEPEVPPSAGLLAAMELLEQVRSLHGTEEPPSQSVKREPGVKSEDDDTPSRELLEAMQKLEDARRNSRTTPVVKVEPQQVALSQNQLNRQRSESSVTVDPRKARVAELKRVKDEEEEYLAKKVRKE